MGEIRRGNRWGLPFNLSAILRGYRGDCLRHPVAVWQNDHRPRVETVSRVGNDLAVAIGLLTSEITATIGINIVANFVSPAFDFSNCAPQKIQLPYRRDDCRGGLDTPDAVEPV